jgi:hypothetical protein
LTPRRGGHRSPELTREQLEERVRVPDGVESFEEAIALVIGGGPDDEKDDREADR